METLLTIRDEMVAAGQVADLGGEPLYLDNLHERIYVLNRTRGWPSARVDLWMTRSMLNDLLEAHLDYYNSMYGPLQLIRHPFVKIPPYGDVSTSPWWTELSDPASGLVLWCVAIGIPDREIWMRDPLDRRHLVLSNVGTICALSAPAKA